MRAACAVNVASSPTDSVPASTVITASLVATITVPVRSKDEVGAQQFRTIINAEAATSATMKTPTRSAALFRDLFIAHIVRIHFNRNIVASVLTIPGAKSPAPFDARLN